MYGIISRFMYCFLSFCAGVCKWVGACGCVHVGGCIHIVGISALAPLVVVPTGSSTSTLCRLPRIDCLSRSRRQPKLENLRKNTKHITDHLSHTTTPAAHLRSVGIN
jgi:hypothetical protein